MKLQDLIGKEVLNVYRQDCELSQAQRDAWKGIVVSVDEDRLPLIGVDCKQEFIRYMPLMDLALAAEYPGGERLDKMIEQHARAPKP